jgi:hypothetical protein
VREEFADRVAVILDLPGCSTVIPVTAPRRDMATPPPDIRLAVESFSAREVPDGRTRVCDLAVGSDGGDTIVTGTVSTHGLADRLFGMLRSFPSVDRTNSSVTVLADIASDCTVAETAVPVRSSPDAGAEQVTQLIYGDEVVAYDSERDWRRVRAADGYVGWADDDAVIPTEPVQTDAVLRANVPIDDSTFAPIGSPCQVKSADSDVAELRFRTGETLRTPRKNILEAPGRPDGGDIVEIANRFRGTNYEWGGMTTEGIDCSGLVWISYRVLGIELPRDTDQQETVGTEVSRDELLAGDLLFFPGHVAISTGGSRYVHAHGSSGGFVESSLDAGEEGYMADLDDGLTCCRRLLPEN